MKLDFGFVLKHGGCQAGPRPNYMDGQLNELDLANIFKSKTYTDFGMGCAYS